MLETHGGLVHAQRRAISSMRRQPVRADAMLHLDGDAVRQRESRLHRGENLRDEFFLLVEREVEDQFVVDLKQHSRLELLFP